MRQITPTVGHPFQPFPLALAVPACEDGDDLNPFDLLDEHPDVTLVFADLPEGERGRWYPDLHVIMIHEGLTQAERRCTLMHEIVHRMRGDSHVAGDIEHIKQERSCHATVARLLIPFSRLQAALTYGRHPTEIADELWVDLETLHARIKGLSAAETMALNVGYEQDQDDMGVA